MADDAEAETVPKCFQLKVGEHVCALKSDLLVDVQFVGANCVGGHNVKTQLNLGCLTDAGQDKVKLVVRKACMQSFYPMVQSTDELILPDDILDWRVEYKAPGQAFS